MNLFFRLLLTGLGATTQAFAGDRITFNQHIRPILSDNCFACHGTDAAHRKARLRLDTAEGARARRTPVCAIVPGKVEESELWQRIVSSHADEVMPPPESNKPRLTVAQRELIRGWIEQGAYISGTGPMSR